MTEQEIRTILNRQREYFATGATAGKIKGLPAAP